MKKLFVFAFLTMNSCISYQTVTFTEEEYFVKVFDNLEDNKDELFIKANDWMITIFKDATSVIEYSDKEAGALIGKYLLGGEVHNGVYGVSIETRIYAKIDVRVKDSRARISIQPLSSWQYDKSGMTIHNYSKEKANEDMNKLAESLQKHLKSEQIDF